jgi:competence protein ComEA
MKSFVYVLVGLLAGFLLAGALFLVTRLPAGRPVALQPPPTEAPIEVHVIGAVLRPGVYLFTDGSRVQDAITAAGGLTTDANTEGINLAAKLEDAQQLNIPGGGGVANTAPQATAAFRVLTGAATATPSTELININTASATELEALPGIGPTLAQRIVDYRTQHGPFPAIEGIMNVAGIGPAVFDQIQGLITV